MNFTQYCFNSITKHLSHVSFFSSTPCPNGTFIQRAQTIMSLFKLCASVRDLKQIHSCIVKCGFGQDLYCTGNIVERCVTFGAIDYGISVFDSVENPDGFLWNSMIRGLGKADQPEKAIELYKRMREIGEFVDSFTFSFLLKVCGQLGLDILGKQFHGSALKHGLESHVFVRNNLIHLYGSFEEVENAVILFDEMPNRDLVSWNTIIGCHVQCGKCKEALGLFSRMFRSGFWPDDATLVAALSACSDLGVLDFGRCIHSYANIMGFGTVVPISNLLVHMYAQCGAMDKAYKMFNSIRQKTLVSWNAMILALAAHGHENEALALFSKMVDGKLEKPDEITFLGVLSACSRGGKVDDGRNYFSIMSKDYHIEPTMKHYGCIVDILGRAGLLEEAYRLIMNMPMECSPVVWRTLLASCCLHSDVELGEKVRKRLLQLESEHSSDYVLLANMYASTGRWDEVVRVRESMKVQQVQKPEPGISLIDKSFVKESLFINCH